MFCSWAINRHSCLYMKVSKKDKALFDARIFLSYSSLIRSDFGKSSRALRFPSYITPNFLLFFSPLVEPLCGLMNTGGAFNDRSIHTMNASFCLFLYYYLAVRNNRALSLSSSLRNSSLVESCWIWETLHRPRREAARYRWDRSRTQKSGPIYNFRWSSRSSPLRPHRERYRLSFPPSPL